jgi:hypothetical protein
MMTTRKQKRVWTTLIVVYFLVLAEAPLVYGQNFAPPSPTQESTVDIKNGSLSTNNFVSLEKASAINLLENKSVTGFFSKNFTINGQVGELENGAVIDDWAVVLEKLKNQDKALINQNITSDQVKTAYESWFRQQRSRRDQFVGDGGGAVQQKNLLILIKESFDFGSGKNPQLKDGTVLKNSSDWESWARKQGLPAAGLALMALYGTVRRRRELEEKEYDGWSEQFNNLSHGANFQNNREYNRIYQNISRQAHTQKQSDYAIAHKKLSAYKPTISSPRQSRQSQDFSRLVAGSFSVVRSVQSVISRPYRLGAGRWGSRRVTAIAAISKRFYQSYRALELSYEGKPVPVAIQQRIQQLKRGYQAARNEGYKYIRTSYYMRNRWTKYAAYRQMSSGVWEREIRQQHQAQKTYNQQRVQYQVQAKVYNQKRQELLNPITQKYRNWSSQFRAFWRDQRAKAGLAVQESTQLKKIITTVKTAFATRQNKSRQQLETKTLNFYASKSKMLNRTFEESRLQKQWDS